MLLKYFYDKALAHASYLVGCQKTGEAIIVDPGRDIEPYLQTAAAEGMKIVGAADTHIHADYVSGLRELGERVGAKLYVSDEGPAEWKYEFVGPYDHQLLRDGDTFHVGKIELKVMFTPGHTPESVSFVLTDRGGGADKPMGIFTGDFVFVGSIGRPDLLEEAAGLAGTAEPGARDLYRSIQRFNELPDYLQVWPAHGAGSACGKGLGALPSSTVGYEKQFNPALQYSDEQAFVDYILSEQPEAPKYFALMKRVNKEGPDVLGPPAPLAKLPVDQLAEKISNSIVVDTAKPNAFAESYVPGVINIQTRFLAMWGGSILDFDQTVYLISTDDKVAEQVRILHKIGLDNIGGYFSADEVSSAGMATASIPQIEPKELSAQLAAGEVELIDVRGASERDEEKIPQSKSLFLGKIYDEVDQLDPAKSYVFQCRTGGRSMVAASVARQAGIDGVVNLAGGIEAWKLSLLPVEPATASSVS